MITIQKIALKDLEHFFYSDFFKKLEFKPISEIRVKSYKNNPRARENDIILFMAFDKKAIVGYRTILSDSFMSGVKQKHFGWLSGSWVHPKHRRKGISTLLFNEVLKDWEGKLMYSNYAEASKRLYDKTNRFQLLYNLEGARFYMRFSLGEILPKKNNTFKKTKMVWKGVDLFLNSVFDVRRAFFRNKKNDFIVKQDEKMNELIVAFIKNNGKNNLFDRGKLEFDWIRDFPWVLSNEAAKTESNHYYFSVYSKELQSNIFTLYDKNENLIAVLFIVIRDGDMKIPYAFFKDTNKELVSSFIVNKVKLYKINTITTYHKDIEKEFIKKLTFIYKKKFVQNFFSTKSLFNFMKDKENIVVQPGDGDSVFT